MRGESIRTTTGTTTGVAGEIADARPLAGDAEAAGGDAALPIDQASVGLVVHSLTVDAEDIVFVKGIVEASDGLAVVFAPPRPPRPPPAPGAAAPPRPPPHPHAAPPPPPAPEPPRGAPGTSAPSRTHTLLLAAPRGRESDLAELVADLGAELASPEAGVHPRRRATGDGGQRESSPSHEGLDRSGSSRLV